MNKFIMFDVEQVIMGVHIDCVDTDQFIISVKLRNHPSFHGKSWQKIHEVLFGCNPYMKFHAQIVSAAPGTFTIQFIDTLSLEDAVGIAEAFLRRNF